MSASAILKLQAAGFSADQVTALAELIDSQASSKADLLEVEHRLETKIGEVEHKLETKIGDVRAELGTKIAVVQWMGSFAIAILVAIALKLFLH